MNTEKEIIASLKMLGGHLRKGLSNQKSSKETDKKIEQVIAEKFHSHSILGKLSKSLRGKVIETTNFDELIEYAFAEAKISSVPYTEKEKVVISEQVVAFCTQRFLKSQPQSVSRKREVEAKVGAAVRKSLARLSLTAEGKN
jgi:rubrerythrin